MGANYIRLWQTRIDYGASSGSTGINQRDEFALDVRGCSPEKS
jgi:hypothetical protein